MKKKKDPESQEAQSARFRAEVERLIVDGELNPTDADKSFGKLVRGASLKPHRQPRQA